VMKNLLAYKQSNVIDYHIVYTINQDEIKNFTIPFLQNASSQRIFYYSPRWNFYYTITKLSKFIHNSNTILIANDWLELGMVSNLGLSNSVVQIIHGDYGYYYNLATIHSRNVDLLFCINTNIYNKICINNSPEKVIDWKFPVPDSERLESYKNDLIIAYFVSDLTNPNKNYRILPLVDKLLIQRGVFAKWRIAGSGMSIDENAIFWGESADRVDYYGYIEGEKLDHFLNGCNAMLLPSEREGFPVSVVEAMKRGIVPFVTFWNNGLNELIEDGVSGFFSSFNDSEKISDNIVQFIVDPNKQINMQKEAKRRADFLFNPVSSCKDFESNILQIKPKIGQKVRIYGSRLDHQLIPNFIVLMIRSIVNIFK
jgi:glycosyltransferase involved in cell wall biosynthesis